jgi:hypothetical protein
MTTSPLLGTKTLLFGDIGTGKTRAIQTLLDVGIKPLCIFTEQGYGVLGDALKEKVSWVYVRPITGSLVDLRRQIEAIGTKDQAELGRERDNTTGRRALLDKPDYMLAQTQLENFLAVFCALRCHVLMTAHAEKEIDQLHGGMRITPVLPGKVLAGKVGRDFDEVLLAQRKGVKFDWTNVEEGALGKKRYLPYAAGQAPAFGPLIEAWKKAGGVIEQI